MAKKRILVAVLNWGLGHASRSIPIIKELQSQGFEVLMASDGEALELLKKEFPNLRSFQLPSYKIRYATWGRFFKFKMLLQTPHILKTIAEEKKFTRTMVESQNIDGIISDNRWGVYSKKTPSVFITHQVKVLSGQTSVISSKIQQKHIQKFDECWIPDMETEPYLSGRLGHLSSPKFNIKYLGIISRFNIKEVERYIDVLIILSGPEPQRSILEAKLIKEFRKHPGKVILVKGIVQKEQITEEVENITTYNFMQSEELEHFINTAKLVVARSGYTTLLDLAKLKKKAFFIPTPGQPEQEYLAKRLKKLKMADSCHQNEFKLEKLDNSKNYKGLVGFSSSCELSSLFALFQGK